MKKIILTLLFISSFTLTAQELKWETDINVASRLAIKQKKVIMMFFTGSDWCGWCTRLQKEVFYTDDFKKWANNNVVLLELDYPRNKVMDEKIKNQNNHLQRIFAVQGYPSVHFVKPIIAGDKLDLQKLGDTGYIAGGPSIWLTEANKQLAKKKK